jgi:hypothetical protein
MPRIIDSHVHLYAPEAFADPVAWGTARGEAWWTRCVAPEKGRTLQGWATVDQLLRDMDAAGVDHAVLLGWYWEKLETCELQNTWFAAWIREHPDRLSAFAAVQPAAGDLALDTVRRALDKGLIGIGELKAPVQGFSYQDETWCKIVELAIEAQVPLNLHVTDPVATPPNAPARPTPLEEFLALARDFPEARFILAHFGGGLPFYELNPAVQKALCNVLYDTAAAPLLYRPEITRRVVDLVGAKRVLFGTDYPLLTHPRETREPEFAKSLRDLRAAGLTIEELDAVLGENAAEVLRLG